MANQFGVCIAPRAFLVREEKKRVGEQFGIRIKVGSNQSSFARRTMSKALLKSTRPSLRADTGNVKALQARISCAQWRNAIQPWREMRGR